MANACRHPVARLAVRWTAGFALGCAALAACAGPRTAAAAGPLAAPAGVTAGAAVVHSSKNTIDGPIWSATRMAQAGGARVTVPAPDTTGRPAKSLGS